MTAALVGLLLSAGPKPTLQRTALEELAVRVAEQADTCKPEAPVGVFVDGQVPVLARAFASALSSELATRKRAPQVIDVPTPAEAESAARAHDVRTLVRISLQLDGQRLTARGDAFHTWVNFWAGTAPTRVGPSAAIAATVDADAQVLTLGAQGPAGVPASGPLKLAVTSLARLTGVPAALAFGDLDGDGKAELAVLQDDALVVLDLDGKTRWRSELKELPAASSPAREAFGALAVLSSPPRLQLQSTRKARGAVLYAKNGKLEAAAADQALALDGVQVRTAGGLNVFDRQIVLAGRNVDLPAPFTATSTRSGATLVVYPDGTAMLLKGAVPGTRFSGAGAASALADLDGDGTPEVILSSTRFFPDGDEVKVLSLQATEGLQARSASAVEGTPLWQGTTPRGRALTALGADLDGDKSEELVLGVWLPDGTGELLALRRVTTQ